MARSVFAGLTVSHPASWRQYFLRPSDDLDPASAGYLTNEPIAPGCGTPPGDRVVCGQPVTKLTATGVYITISARYQPFTALPQQNETIGGYPADVATGADPSTSGCPPAATLAITATAASPNVQPSQVWIFACLGTDTRQAQREVTAMLTTARIASRPPATTPVRGAPRCTGTDLTVSLGPRLSPATQERGFIYAVKNTGTRTCRTSGYPTVRLSTASADLPFTYHDGGSYILDRPRQLYLRAGDYASFQIYTTACETSTGTPATITHIRLPGQPTVSVLAATSRTGGAAMAYCARPNPGGNVVDIGPLVAF